jgi:hypothetical protein
VPRQVRFSTPLDAICATDRIDSSDGETSASGSAASCDSEPEATSDSGIEGYWPPEMLGTDLLIQTGMTEAVGKTSGAYYERTQRPAWAARCEVSTKEQQVQDLAAYRSVRLGRSQDDFSSFVEGSPLPDDTTKVRGVTQTAAGYLPATFEARSSPSERTLSRRAECYAQFAAFNTAREAVDRNLGQSRLQLLRAYGFHSDNKPSDSMSTASRTLSRQLQQKRHQARLSAVMDRAEAMEGGVWTSTMLGAVARTDGGSVDPQINPHCTGKLPDASVGLPGVLQSAGYNASSANTMSVGVAVQTAETATGYVSLYNVAAPGRVPVRATTGELKLFAEAVGGSTLTLRAILDSGAAYTALHINEANRLGLHVNATTVRFAAVNGEPLKVAGMANLYFQLGTKRLPTTCFVFHELAASMLLGTH